MSFQEYIAEETNEVIQISDDDEVGENEKPQEKVVKTNDGQVEKEIENNIVENNPNDDIKIVEEKNIEFEGGLTGYNHDIEFFMRDDIYVTMREEFDIQELFSFE